MTTDLSPAAALARVAARAPSSISIVDDDDTELTAATVQRQVTALAARFAAGGTRPGDRIAYAGRNSPTLLLTMLAAAHVGAVFVPLNFRLAEGETRQALQHCGASTLVSESERRPLLDRALVGTAVTQFVDTPGAWQQDTALPVPERVLCSAEDLAVLLSTSGSSGKPKAVRLTHGNLWWAARNIDEAFPTGDDDVTLAIAPMFHIGGLNSFTLRTLVRGGTVLVRRSFDAARTLTDLSGAGVTALFGVPAMYAALARCPGFGKADLSGVRSAISGGAPLPPRLVELFAARGMLVRNSWGMTETAPAATCLPAADVLTRPGSVGLPLPHTRVRLVCPDTGLDVHDADQVGELWAKGPNVTQGYWEDAEATAAVLTPDGWLRTGDLAVRDADGYLFIVGRRSELINTGGEKVLPAEVEEALANVPGTTEIVVVGAPDETWGERVVAVAESVAEVAVTLDDIREHAGVTLARYKLPTRLLVLPALPRTATGKVDRCAIRAMVAEADRT